MYMKQLLSTWSAKTRQINYLKVLVYIGAITPLIWLMWAYLSNNLTVNPIQAATQRTGNYALIFLTLALSVTPVNIITGYKQIITVRRTLGLFAFFYAAFHFAIFVGLDYGFEWSYVIPELFEKRYTIVGFLAGFILLLLAITSFRWWMKRLGKNWKKLHKLVYLAGILVIVHFAWAKKGDIFRLSGDIGKPLLFGSIILILLILRIPAVRKWIIATRRRLFQYRNNSNKSAPTSPNT